MFDEAAERFPQYVSLQESAKKKEPLPGTSYAQKANERIQYMIVRYINRRKYFTILS